MRKLKIFFLTVTVIGFISLSVGCKKTYTTVVQSKDSVYSSGWMPLNDSVYYDQVGDTIFQETFGNVAITQSIVSDGVVLSYLGYNSSATDTAAQAASEFAVSTIYQVGSVTIQSFPEDENGFGDLNGIGLFYRYVIVPGSVLATMSLTPKQAKTMSYTAITKALAAAKQSSSAAIPQ